MLIKSMKCIFLYSVPNMHWKQSWIGQTAVLYMVVKTLDRRKAIIIHIPICNILDHYSNTTIQLHKCRL